MPDAVFISCVPFVAVLVQAFRFQGRQASENAHRIRVEFLFRDVYFVVASLIQSSLSGVSLKFEVMEDTEWTHTPCPERGHSLNLPQWG